MRKSIISTVLALALVIATAAPAFAQGADRFDDVARDDYFFDAVDWALENGVTDGRSETVFAPGSTCTRAEAVTFLWRYAG
ncbi:MAG: S-layer homology domain-containing protein, partial [Firmicutes bacterium]|nr:S-layer homology domain-containing protein [Bacillota bacterium]MBR0114246.1 S-layer homology domain-containing protein [Bacillota bacterium]